MLESNAESRVGGKAGVIVIVVVVVVGTESRSLATAASNGTRAVPRGALVAVTLVNRGDRFGLVRA